MLHVSFTEEELSVLEDIIHYYKMSDYGGQTHRGDNPEEREHRTVVTRIAVQIELALYMA